MNAGVRLVPVVLVAAVAFLWASVWFEARVFTLGLESGMLNLDAALLASRRTHKCSPRNYLCGDVSFPSRERGYCARTRASSSEVSAWQRSLHG